MLTQLRDRFQATAYRTQQLSMMLPLVVLHRIVELLVDRGMDLPDASGLESIRGRYQDLLERDLRNVETGMYPRELLFQMPIGHYAWTMPWIFQEIVRMTWRRFGRKTRDLPEDVDLDRYPAYFRQNFHWQTDGYLSLRSAELYDLGVEMLFLGTADVMRRQAIPPVSQFLAENLGPEVRLLDVGCGTGRFLRQMATAHPRLRLFGVDLSPYYLQFARQLLADVPDVSLIAENAEKLPFVDGHFDVVTSVFLFHELPRSARRRVLAEAHRVLRPGGLLVIEDSGQLTESPELSHFARWFQVHFHEPYIADYVHDDLGELLRGAGFEVQSVEQHFVSKLAVGRR